MKKIKKSTKKPVVKYNPVAKVLSEGQFQHQVKPSKKVYKRADNKGVVRAFLQGGNVHRRAVRGEDDLLAGVVLEFRQLDLERV